MKFKSKISQLYDQFEKQGKLIELTDDEIIDIRDHIHRDMENFRLELLRKQKQSEKDTHAIILTH